MANEELYNKPERGGQPGVYEIVDVNGVKKHLVADSHPMADAYIRMNATYVMTIEEWRAKHIEEKVARSQAEQTPEPSVTGGYQQKTDSRGVVYYVNSENKRVSKEEFEQNTN